MSLWSDIINDHLKLVRRTAPEDLIQEVLRTSAVPLLPDGHCNAETLGDLIRYLESVEEYLGKLYKQRAEDDFTEVINQGWVQMDSSAQLLGTLKLEVDAAEALGRHLENKAEQMELSKERAEASMRANGAFFTSMVDRIKTPMNGITGSAMLLQESVANDYQDQLCGVLSRSVDDLKLTFNDLVDYMQLAAGRFELVKEPFDIVEAFQAVEKMVQPFVNEKNLSLNFKIESAMPRYLVGDVVRIQQVLMNLLKNAIRFTKQGAVTVNLGMDYISDERVNAIFDIEDSGVGISRGDLLRMRGVLMRKEALSRPDQKDGIGLGLSLCKAIVRLMGGQIDLVSELAQGTVFTVTLPLEITSEQAIDTANLGLLGQRNYRKKVLLADGDKAERCYLVEVLKQVGVNTEVVDNGQEALYKAEEHDYDLILLDMNTAVRDGVEVTRHIRMMDNVVRGGTPIIAIASEWNTLSNSRFLDVGVDGIITKPVRTSWLLRELDSWFSSDRKYMYPATDEQ